MFLNVVRLHDSPYKYTHIRSFLSFLHFSLLFLLLRLFVAVLAAMNWVLK